MPHKLGEVSDCSSLTHNYFQWEMGNNTATRALSADDSAFADTARTDTRLVDSANLNDTNKVYVGQVAQDSSDEKKRDYAGVSPESRKLLEIPSCEAISMAEYWGKTIPADFVGWVVDEDGWAYWTRQLGGGEATGYLLNSVKRTAALGDQSYTYKINVTYEAVTVEDMGLWVNGSGELTEGGQARTQVEAVDAATDEALMLLHDIGWRDGDSAVKNVISTALRGRMDAHIAEIDAKQEYGSKGAKRIYANAKGFNWESTSWLYKTLQIAKKIQKEIDELVKAGKTADAKTLLTQDVSTQFNGSIKNGIVKALEKQGKINPTTFTQDDLNSIEDITFEHLTPADMNILAGYQDRLPNIGILRLHDLQTTTLDVSQFPFNQAWWWNIVDTGGTLNQIGSKPNTLDFSQCESMQGILLQLQGGTALSLAFPAHLAGLALLGNRVIALDLNGLSELEQLRIGERGSNLTVSGWVALQNLRTFAIHDVSFPIAVDLSVCRRLLQLRVQANVSALTLPTDTNAFDDGVGAGGGYNIAFGGTTSTRELILPKGAPVTNLEQWRAEHPKAPEITYWP